MTAPLFDASAPRFIELLGSCPVVPGATVSKPLINLPQGKIIVFSMDAGQEISEHRAPFIATVQVLDGKLRMGVGGVDKVMGPHDWLVMPADEPHRLLAIDPTRIVLTLFKQT